MSLKIMPEVYSRVSGYFRPVAQWNNAKKAEFSDRRNLNFDRRDIPASEAELTEAI